MSNVAAARQKYVEAKKEVEDCQRSIVELQRKADVLQESLPGLVREIENAERAKVSALDAFALDSNEKTSKRLGMARTSYDQATRQQIEANELLEATFRAVKNQEAELIRLNEACSQIKRAVWAAIAEDLKLKISAETIEIIQQFALVSSTQLGGNFEYYLKSLFPQPGHNEMIAILEQFREKYQID